MAEALMRLTGGLSLDTLYRQAKDATQPGQTTGP
jgi:hypothetical protein